MKYIFVVTLLSQILLISEISANNDPCNCDDVKQAADAIASASSYNEASIAYLDYQIAHVKFYKDLSQKLLSSGHQTGVMTQQLKKISSIASTGISVLNKERGRLAELNMGPREYKAELSRINSLGTKEFSKASEAMRVIINGGDEFTATADGPPVDSDCTGQRTDLIQACLDAIEEMMACGVYDDISTTQLRNDQDKCTDKGNAILAICLSENGSGRRFNAHDDIQNEMTKALNACSHHNDIKQPGGPPAQQQTSSGN